MQLRDQRPGVEALDRGRKLRHQHIAVAGAPRIGAEALVSAKLLAFEHVATEPPILLVVADRERDRAVGRIE